MLFTQFNMNMLTTEKLEKGISLIDIAKELNKDNIYVVKNWRIADDDGISGKIKMLNDKKLLEEFNKLLENDNNYTYKTISFSHEYIEIGLYKGINDAEELWKFFNISEDKFDYIIEKDFFDDVLT